MCTSHLNIRTPFVLHLFLLFVPFQFFSPISVFTLHTSIRTLRTSTARPIFLSLRTPFFLISAPYLLHVLPTNYSCILMFCFPLSSFLINLFFYLFIYLPFHYYYLFSFFFYFLLFLKKRNKYLKIIKNYTKNYKK